jgi:hypothetical protein
LETTRLLVYWVHIEVVYGRMSGFSRDSLSTTEPMAMEVTLARRVSGD